MISLPYIAGFFDGEGSIGIYRASRDNRERFCLRTQLVQNLSAGSSRIFGFLSTTYGGVASRCQKVGGAAANWQLNGGNATVFLLDVLPHLMLKKDQAELAIGWQLQRPPLGRNELGRITLRSEPNIEFDRKVCRLMKALKKADIDQVMANQSDLVEVVHTLKQVVCVKVARG